MFDQVSARISTPVVQAIYDAILLGHVREIDAVLDLVREDDDFPQTLFYGLEALRYYRQFYGRGGELEPRDSEVKNRMLQLETLWGREMIESMNFYSQSHTAQYA